MSPGVVPTPTDRYDYYPDPYGARQISWSVPQAATGTNVELQLQDAYDWQALIFQNPGNGSAANPGVYTVSWWADPQGTLSLGSEAFVVGVSMDATVVLPVRGPWVSVSSASISGAGTHVAGGSWSVSSAPPSSLRPPVLLHDLTTTVAASSSTTVNGTTVRSGAGSMWGSNLNAATGWFTDLQILDYATNGWKAVARLGAANQWVDRATFWLPPAPWRVVYTNRDGAAAHSLGANVTIGN